MKTHLSSLCNVLLAFAMLNLGLAKAGGQEGSHPVTQAEWTIMVFMNGDNNLENDALDDFLEMAKVGSSDKIKIVVQLDRSPEGTSRFGDWEGVMRFVVAKDMTPVAANASPDGSSVDFKNDGRDELNMGDPSTLREFVSWAKGVAPAKRNMLIIWNHGQGYRLMLKNALLEKTLAQLSVEDFTSKPKALAAMLARDRGFSAPSSITSKSVSNDDTDHGMFYNREIQDALAGSGLDIIGFDACLMAMVETAYAMRTSAKFMIGSEDLEPGSGWQYDEWLAKLVSSPAMAPADLSKQIVQSYAQTYGPNGPLEDATTTLSAVNLEMVEPLAQSISALSHDLMQNLETKHKYISAARQACKVFAPKPFAPDPRDYFQHIDFGQFCDSLMLQSQLSSIHASAKTARELLGKAVVARYAGARRQGGYGSLGLAIYFPAGKNLYETDPFEEGGYKKANAFYPIEFVQTQKWADFLHAYFTKVP